MLSSILRITGRFLKWAVIIGLGLTAVLAVAGFFIVRSLIMPNSDQFGQVEDEAKRAGRTLASLLGEDDDKMYGADEPYFVDMDKGLLAKPGAGEPYPDEILQVALDLNPDNPDPEAVRQAAIRGQNMWLVWTGGNDAFWDYAALNTIGAFDLLKVISSYQGENTDGNSSYGRFNRFRWIGVTNEPCFEQATKADLTRFGLWLDKRSEDCAPDPFADAGKYPGIKVPQEDLESGDVYARGEVLSDKIAQEFPESLEDGKLPVWSYYGEPTGVMGLRLFPNPNFDAAASENWDSEKYYTEPNYYNNTDLVRPYRVGMACAFCHVGPNPITPPKNVEEPTFAEINSNPGAQYYWVDRIFFWNTSPRDADGTPAPNEANLLFQLFHTNPLGTLDTSLVSTDYMNNPRTMNAVYETRGRLFQAAQTGIERIEGDERDNKQFQDYPRTEALTPLYNPETGDVASMRVLKDGSDSVGTLGALNRVYLNIGLFSEEWIEHFRPFLGGRFISPIKISDAQKNSVFWQATEAQTPDMATFFLVAGRADKLADTKIGESILKEDAATDVDRGMEVFAETCAACHSDIEHQPTPDPSFGVNEGICQGGGAGPRYLECWDRFWDWAQSDSFKSQMTARVKADDFLDGNYLSNERRVPMDVLGVNACGPIATNGLKGDIWDNFTSETYKTLPAVGEVTIEHPVSGGASGFQALGNGRGYLRPASLVSLWTSAPYLLNNSVGYEQHHYSADYYADVEPDDYSSDYSSDSSTPDYSGNYSSGYEYPANVSCPSAYPDDPYMPCIANRVNNFERSIRKLLSPETRTKDTQTTEPVPGYMYRTSAPACLIVPPNFSPKLLRNWSGFLNYIAPWAITKEGGIEVGPFPAKFPINTLLNSKLLPDNDEDISLLAHGLKLAKAGPALISAVIQLGGQCSAAELADPATNIRAQKVIDDTGLVDTLVGLSKCPDYVVNKGHGFGADLSTADKDALITYLKRF